MQDTHRAEEHFGDSNHHICWAMFFVFFFMKHRVRCPKSLSLHMKMSHWQDASSRTYRKHSLRYGSTACASQENCTQSHAGTEHRVRRAMRLTSLRNASGDPLYWIPVSNTLRKYNPSCVALLSWNGSPSYTAANYCRALVGTLHITNAPVHPRAAGVVSRAVAPRVWYKVCCFDDEVADMWNTRCR